MTIAYGVKSATTSFLGQLIRIGHYTLFQSCHQQDQSGGHRSWIKSIESLSVASTIVVGHWVAVSLNILGKGGGSHEVLFGKISYQQDCLSRDHNPNTSLVRIVDIIMFSNEWFLCLLGHVPIICHFCHSHCQAVDGKPQVGKKQWTCRLFPCTITCDLP